MKKYIVFLLLFIASMLLAMFWFGLSQKKPTGVGEAVVAKIKISSKTPGATVYVDSLGPYSPPHTATVALGDHQVEVIANGFLSKTERVSVKDPKIVLQVNIDLDLSPEPGEYISFFKLLTEPEAIAVGGNRLHTYYVIRDEIREIKTFQMKAKLPGAVQATSWSGSGKGLFLTSAGWYMFTPANTLTKTSLPSEPVFMLNSGSRALIQDGGALKLHDFDSSNTIDVGTVDSQLRLVKAVFDLKDTYAVLVLKTINNLYNVAILTFSDNQIKTLEESLEYVPSLAISDNGDTFVFVSKSGTKVYQTGSLNPIKTIALTGSLQNSGVSAYGYGYLIFEKSKLNGTGDSVTAIYRINPPDWEKKFALYDVPIKNRLNVGFVPQRVGSGLVFSENNGTLWYLGNPTNLPKSLFDSSLPPEYFNDAP